MWPNPAVDVASVIANLEPLSLNGFDEVKVFGSTNAAENDVADRQARRINGHDSTQLSGFDPALHRGTAGPDLNCLASLESRDVTRRPSHAASLGHASNVLPGLSFLV
jgi:hypothetical protein